MITPADKPFRDAVRRADVRWLSGHIDARLCPSAVFGPLIRRGDPDVRHLGLILLAERVASVRAGDAPGMAELAELLPTSVEGPPEAALVLARLYERLAPYLREPRTPAWRSAGLPARVRIAWLRAELLNEPTALRKEAPGELLYQAVRETTVTRAHRPEQLVDELVDSGDPVLQAAALRLAREGLHAGLLAPVLVRGHLIGLLGAGSADVAAAALDELGEPWAALAPLPLGCLSPFLAADSVVARPAAADAALTAAARHGHAGLLWQVVEDPDLPPGLRRRGMELLGDLAARGDISALTAVAARDPLLFGGPAMTCLRGLHRRGHFADAAQVPSVLGLALADHTIAPAEVATILFTCRQEMFRALVDAPAEDPCRPRRIALLVALAGQGAGELPIGDAITRALPSAPAPGPLLDAIRALRHTDAEEAVIALLPSAPAAALAALEAIGGHRTTAVLRRGLGLAAAPDPASATAPTSSSPGESAGVIAPHLRAVRDRALEVLWHLTQDPAQRRDVLDRLDPADLPPRIAVDLGGPDERELALLSSHLDPGRPVAALRRLAAHGGAGSLPVIADLLLRVVAELAGSHEPGGTAPRSDGGRPAGEPVVPGEVLEAVHGLGRRLHERGRIRPSCLLDAATAEEAGHALVATMALDLLDRPGLSAAEQAILLEVLLRAPYAGTRARVHRLLRHRDRHVRKHVIALLARDATGDDAQALSATLIALTAAQDVQTVRQALLALGHARARWASPTIAACLGHPNMNVKKTAAEVLVGAGTPLAVPAMLHWLGRHDNPGLRGTLVEALRGVLGDAYPATVLAAAEHSEDARTRELLLEGLDRTLSARSVLALDGQSSRVAPTLLTLLATGRIRLASGTAWDLSTAMAHHGITPPAVPPPTVDTGAEHDVRKLTEQGWDPSVALRLAARPELPDPTRLRALRPMLADWLRLAGREPAVRARLVLRLTLRLCPAPWTAGELTAFGRSTNVLLDGLSGLARAARAADPAGPAGPDAASARDRDDLIAVLEAVAPRLAAAGRAAVARTVRALPPAPAGSRSTLTLLRALGAVLVRADLDQALASARLGAGPWEAEAAVLREAFAAPHHSPSATAGAGRWRAALDAAVRSPKAREELRRLRERQDGVPGSRERLDALIDAYPGADPEVRAALVDWMTDVQPLDAPSWTIAETARAAAPGPRTVHVDDLDQPRSTALRERLLAMLAAPAPDRRRAAALALAKWPEPEAPLAVLRAYLRGRVDVRVDAVPARALTAIGEAELRADGVLHDRVALVAARLDACELEPLVPLLLEWWEHDPPGGSSAAGRALRAVPADVLAEHLGERLDAGAWGFLDLLHGRSVLRTPALTRARRRLRAEGRDDQADRLLLVEGPLRRPDAAERDAAALAVLRHRAPAAPAQASAPPSRQELLDLARSGEPARVRQALTWLAAGHRGPDADRDPGLRELLAELLRHPRPGVRLHAHRTSRAMLDRPAHLHHTSMLLDDPQPDLVRTAIRTLCHAAWAPAAPAMTGLLEHPHPAVRKAAAEGLVGMGTAAVPALRHAAVHARPDKRSLYTVVLERIETAGAG
ncbi:HEAT repeat domain-containing protein [Streptomyces sp. M-16]|uniref:HEAT repeat domain-containing protein n=1 Tax=Streptomyces sp. M-16 TaxID=3233040 RepID=UPI003F9D34B2